MDETKGKMPGALEQLAQNIAAADAEAFGDGEAAQADSALKRAVRDIAAAKAHDAIAQADAAADAGTQADGDDEPRGDDVQSDEIPADIPADDIPADEARADVEIIAAEANDAEVRPPRVLSEEEKALHQMQRYWLWLCSVNGMGLKRMYQLLDMYEDVSEIFALAQRRDIRAFTGLGARVVENLFDTAQEGYIDSLMEKLRKLRVKVITRLSPEYPPLLSQIYAPPALLYVKGQMPLSAPLPIAVVGTRAPTRYGLETARNFSRELVDAGATVVSGLARGIDAAAHEGALEGQSAMPTLAVLGCGVDVPYPSGNRHIYDAIVERGAVISEYAPGVPPSPGHFPARNRIISGLARGVVVVESGERSGTLFTVNYALEQGRDVFSVPGRICDETSRGTNRLIKEGAKLITSIEDVLEEYGLVKSRESVTRLDISAYDYPERSILSLLQTGEKAFDELAEELDVSASELNSTLTSLEFRGIIKQLPGRMFYISAKR